MSSNFWKNLPWMLLISLIMWFGIIKLINVLFLD